MADIKTIEKVMEQIAPPHLMESWDNCGFQIRCSRQQDIRKILVSLEISDELISEAIEKEADLIVTHHPMIFGKINKVDDADLTGHYILRLVQAGISVYSAHTSFDSAKDGTNQYLAEEIGLSQIVPLEPLGEEGCGMGRVGVYETPVTFDDFAERLKEACDENIFRMAGKQPDVVKKVTLCTGAGAEFISAAKANGSDIYITGDVKYHDARTACETGICVVDAGHFGTENIFSVNFACQLAELCPEEVEILVAETDLNPFEAF